MKTRVQKQKEERKPGSYLDCFRGGLALDVMGHAGSLVHVSGPWTVHDARRREFQDELETKSPLLDFSRGCCLRCCGCCASAAAAPAAFSLPHSEVETLSDWRAL